MDDLDRILEERLKDPDFAEEWKRSRVDYEIMKLLVEARSGAKMSQAELSKRTGIAQPNISRLEHGTSSPTIRTLEQLATGLGKELKVSFI